VSPDRLPIRPPRRGGTARGWFSTHASQYEIVFLDVFHRNRVCETRIWFGQVSIAAALADGSLRLDGARAETEALPRWFALSHFAPIAAE
jgi:hypothetical protein